MRQVVEAPTRANITGLILAGGQGERMGGRDKGLIDLAGRPLIAHVIARLAPQVAALLISANRNPERYAEFPATIVADVLPDYPGPLAGILSGLCAARTPWLMVVPCDSPFMPLDLVQRLAVKLPSAATIAVVEAAGELQPVFALIPTTLHASLAEFLRAGQRKITRWFAHHAMVAIAFEETADFMNINTEHERELALRRLADA
jgi:molybdenum cofactor guanylyltransferase